jgi:hypothetical protein
MTSFIITVWLRGEGADGGEKTQRKMRLSVPDPMVASPNVLTYEMQTLGRPPVSKDPLCIRAQLASGSLAFSRSSQYFFFLFLRYWGLNSRPTP